MKGKNLVGIDLGTTYSSLHRLDADLKPQPVANAEGEFSTPSVVFFPDKGAAPIVGKHAIRPSFNHPERFVSHAKRWLGDRDVDWEIDGVIYTPIDISAFIVRKLLRDAEAQIGPIEDAVITVPAHYTAYQRQLTIEAGKQAGLQSVSIVNEPVAAALSYALGEDSMTMLWIHDSFTILVYDLGGGTFDLSLVRYDREQLQVLATSGERRLGGMDWDQRLVDVFADAFADRHGLDPREDERALRRLAYEAEQAKHALSTLDSTSFLFQHANIEEEFCADRQSFEQLTKPLVDRTRVLTEDILKAAGLTWRGINWIIPVGGSTRMPMIRRLLEKLTQNLTGGGGGMKFLSPDLSIAQGAALFSGMIHGRSGGAFLADNAMAKALASYGTKTVCGTTLGVIVRDERGRRIHTLIRKNTPLPASATLKVGTYEPNQRQIHVKIVEGEVEDAARAKIVCTCVVDHLPKNLPVNSLFDVILSYDADGLLQVVANHRDSDRGGSAGIHYDR